MPGTFYKGLGFVVWKGALWYGRRRYGGKSKQLALRAVAAGTLVGVAAAAVRRAR